MKELLMALSLFMGILNGHTVSIDGSDTATTTTLASAAVSTVPHQIELNLCKCDKIPDGNKRNLCYAEASCDPFFCERILEQELKDRCYQQIAAGKPN
jgi:hypothetical protein